jgi:hypothetical protein
MKKTYALILALFVSMAGLAVEATRSTAAAADLYCNALTNCCNDEHCTGPGTPSECQINCQNGTQIDCPKKK